MLSPKERYQKDLLREDFKFDPAQAEAVEHLQKLYLELIAVWKADQKRAESLFGRLSARLTKKPKEPVRGLYFWGGVGRGKTYLMDCFYESLPFPEKMRSHFHRFMRRVHHELKALDGHKNPLKHVADVIAKEARVICFDEFFVSDIADAMILGTLMQELFARGVTLVATSNIVPSGLYKDGLQRSRFLPAIALLEKFTQVVNVDGGIDYRLRTLTQAKLFYSPLGEAADAHLRNCFLKLMPPKEEVVKGGEITIEGRQIPMRAQTEGLIWFDFVALCDGPRSQNDYIEIGCEFHTVLVSNVPQMGAKNDDAARRFINMVDEFYDRQVKIILSAEVDIEVLYAGGRLTFEFQRTISRLLEMQSEEFLALPHRP
jgi:cell division protein ZapE